MAAEDAGIEGILVIDKPAGITSHDTVERVRHLLKLQRVGHTGTLDPSATGVMVLCVGRATRVARYFEGLDKAYRAVLKLGVVTDTGDGDGAVLDVKPVPELSSEQIEVALGRFRGAITQQPPAFSAVKVGGERLYARARRGERVSPPFREVTIKTLRLESHEGDRVTLFIECSKGTYIRSLAHDIGRLLGCGAHCLSLVRTKVGPFPFEEALALEELEGLGEKGAAEKLTGLDEALGRFMEPISLTSRGTTLLIHGSPIEEEAVARPPATVRLGTTYRALDSGGELVALVEAEKRPQGVRWIPCRVLAARI